ncbi:hypothetical protein M5K25_022768 [Dendrobium thyrsiflorum]|uniref:Uncharacterized protein n=1 Tax=Dendrobium thyrsiflorum TaxID=117978 RepID=A0ABD0U6W2_DENTH
MLPLEPSEELRGVDQGRPPFFFGVYLREDSGAVDLTLEWKLEWRIVVFFVVHRPSPSASTAHLLRHRSSSIAHFLRLRLSSTAHLLLQSIVLRKLRL